MQLQTNAFNGQDDIEQDDQLRGIFMMLDRVDVHCTWVSQAVLRLLPADIPDVPGGEVVRDPGPGVFCDNAMDMVMEMWPQPGDAEKAQSIWTAMRALNKVGLVGIADAGVTADNVRLFAKLASSSNWTVRVDPMLECRKRNTFCPDEAPTFVWHRHDMLYEPSSVKLFAGKHPQIDTFIPC